MLTRQYLHEHPELARAKAVGCLCGLAIGDSLGDAARRDSNRANYGITTDFNAGASWSTDDTEFALLTAKTLLDCGGRLTTQDVVDAWLRDVAVQDEFKRGGASEVSAALNLRRGLRPPQSGKFSTFHMSDGAAMRISPVGVVCAGDLAGAARTAEIEASISHYADGVWGAQAVAVAVAAAMADATIDEIIDAAMSVIPTDSWLCASMRTAMRILQEKDGSVADAWMPLHDALLSSAWATTAEAIPSAFACVKLRGGDFKSGMLLAANFGRDADTIGAVTGAILGAKYGVEAIPAAWVEKTRHASGTCLQCVKGFDIVEMGEKLAALI